MKAKYSGVELDREDFSDVHSIRVMSRFQGSLKKKFLEDIKKGEMAADLLRDMAKFWYANKPQRANGY